jgi:hypothetical protein
MYMDKLDGRISNEFFDAKAAEFRAAQCGLMRDIETHQSANQSCVEDGIRLLELAHQAASLFENQPPAEKRKLLDFVLSNCRWKDGQLARNTANPLICLQFATQNALGEVLRKKRPKMRPGSPENPEYNALAETQVIENTRRMLGDSW